MEKRRSGRLTIAIVDDHRVLLDGLTSWIRRAASDVEVAIATSSWADLMAHPAFPVDVVLLDLQLGDGVPAATKIAALRAAGVATVVVSSFADPAWVRECVVAGALGYVSKSEDAGRILDAARAAARGETYLTPHLVAALHDDGDARVHLSSQERRALVLYASGLPLRSVAQRLGVHYETAKQYLDRVREKYAEAGRPARTKLELRDRAVEDGLIHGTDPT
jgi:DNA-binding NarL/FixJ family response regulator